MKNIIIKRLSIVNFKGIRNLDIDFYGLETKIRGANGTGKTTIFDAFTWLLFGKDSKDRTKFNLKTLDASGEVIPQIPHEVSATLNVDGETISLRRCWTEIWTNRRGSSEQEFSHNEGERYYNDVPCSDKEFKEKIDAICTESRFRELTNPFYFTSQSKEYQRNALLAMVGDLSIEEIVATDPKAFGKILDKLSGKTLDEFEREVAFHKKRIKAAIADLEPRLDEKKRDLSALSVEDWSALETALNERKSQIADIDAQIADRSKAYEAAAAERSNIAKEIAQLQSQYDQRQLSLKQELLADYRKALSDYQDTCREIDNINADTASVQRTLESRVLNNQYLIREAEAEREKLTSQREKLLNEYYSLMNSTFDENEAVCPTCHRPYETAERDRMELTFIESRNKAIESNKEKGKQIKVNIVAIDERIAGYNSEIEQTQSNIANLQFKSKENLVAPTMPNIGTQLADDAQSLHIEQQIAELREKLAQEVRPADTSELARRKQAINDEIISLNSRLSVRAQITRIEERVSELETALTANRSELEEDNLMELLIFNINKARMDLLEARINAMFKYVKFRMYNRLNNGELAETCECMIDGVPYSDLNSAAKINAGLDIINAICRVYDMCAPIFIDNRESITSIISTDAQVISLIVDADCNALDIE